MATEKGITTFYDAVLGIMSEYENAIGDGTLNGFTLWILRKKSADLIRHKEKLQRKVLKDCEELKVRKQ